MGFYICQVPVGLEEREENHSAERDKVQSICPASGFP